MQLQTVDVPPAVDGTATPVGAAPPAPARARTADPTRRLLRIVCLVLVGLIVIDRARLLSAFGLKYIDEDQALMWMTAQDLLHGRVFTPNFYGQAYGGWIEALLAVPVMAAGVAERLALPIVSTVAGTAPCLVLAFAAWRRRAPLLA